MFSSNMERLPLRDSNMTDSKGANSTNASPQSLPATLADPPTAVEKSQPQTKPPANSSVLWKCDMWNGSESLLSTGSNDEESQLGESDKDLMVHEDLLSLDTWVTGGPLGSKNSVLIFRSSALANVSELSVQNKPAYRLHITYKVLQAETKLLAKLLECHGVTEVPTNTSDFNILWTGSHPKPGILRCLAVHQRVNHFPRSYELTRKDRLYKNIEKMQHIKGYKHFDFIPQTFVMPTEYKDLCTTHHRTKGPWIVKPVASSRGRGIYIVETPNQVPLEEPVVVAKYISKPLLVEGHKCDLRLYVAVTCFDPLLIYIYEEGMVRFATVKYDTSHKTLWNPCMHLCNYSINKYHSDYVKSDDPTAENVGHKWTLSALLRHLKALGKDTAYLMSQIEDLVVKAILSSGNSIVTACKMFVPNINNCFELYGFDILVDDTLKPWLLEVNLSPSLGCDSPLDVRLKSAMLADLLTLIGIPAVDPMLRLSNTTISSKTSRTSNSLRMKLSNFSLQQYHRVHSADGLSNTLPKKNSSASQHGRLASSTFSLTAEEQRIVKMAKSQFERRGGFVRIYPTLDSWTKYSQYLDPITGIPMSCSVTSSYNLQVPHNFNLLLFNQLFPEASQTTFRTEKGIPKPLGDRKRDSSLDASYGSGNGTTGHRQDRYERKLSQGHRTPLVSKKALGDSEQAELKRQICDMMKNGHRMTPVEARKTFSQYLSCILSKLANAAPAEGHIEIVVKFLQKASNYLKSPFVIQPPSHKLPMKDRAAIVAKQLNDFIYLYNRETELYTTLSRPSQIPKITFAGFLETAGERDLEEVLHLYAVSAADVGIRKQPPNFQNLLKCLPALGGSCFLSPLGRANRGTVKVSPLS